MYIEQKELFRWRRARKNKQEIAICTKLLVIGHIVLSSISFAVAGPTGEQITSGSGTITRPDAVTTQINQASQRLDINWQTFSTAKTESVNFIQPTSMAVAINRVIGGKPSFLEGALNANGRVFILNESGITFFGTSQVNVGALIATTAKDVTVSDDDKYFAFSGNAYGKVINHGDIHVSEGGFAILAAPYVQNTGTIQSGNKKNGERLAASYLQNTGTILANLGRIELASTRNFTVDLRGDGLIGFTVTKENVDAIAEQIEKLGVDNSGTLQAHSGMIGISANLASSIVQSVVNLGGVVDADAFGAGHNGGTVLVTSVGDLNNTANIHADGGANGNGGTIDTWADGTNRVTADAVLTARGGTDGGNGGLIEVSGAKVIYRGAADASAPKGKGGTLLIDPWDITIADGAGTDDSLATMGDATVYEKNIEHTSGIGVEVKLEATNSITMNDLSDGELKGGSGDITMTAGGGYCESCSITFVDKNNDKITTTSGKITLTAKDSVTGEGGVGTIDIGHLQTIGQLKPHDNGGHITLTAGSGGIKTKDLSTGGTGVSNPGVITLTTSNDGDIETGDISIVAEGAGTASASLSANAGGNLTTGSVTVTATDETSAANASATLHARKDVSLGGTTTVAAAGAGEARATLDARAGKKLDTRAISVLANAHKAGDSAAPVLADASATLIAVRDVHVEGNVEVRADAENSWGDANASASLLAAAGVESAKEGSVELTFGEGSLTIDGNVDVTAEATTSYGNASANASMLAAAAVRHVEDDDEESFDEDDDQNSLRIDGDINVTAEATTSYGNANANALMLAAAGVQTLKEGSIKLTFFGDGGEGSLPGNLTITGDVGVTADAASSYGNADAAALAVLAAADDVTITTDQDTLQVHAEATSAWGNAAADATLIAAAGLDSLTVSEEEGVSTVHAIFGGGELTIDGNIDVTADATAHYAGDATAAATAFLAAGNDVNITTGGDTVNVAATAGTDTYYDDEYYSDGGSATAASGLVAAAGLNDITATRAEGSTPSTTMSAGGGDLTITGDINAKADATVGSKGKGNAKAAASALLAAGNNVDIHTNWDTLKVEATANNYGYGEADATAALLAAAGVSELGVGTDGVPTDVSYGEGALTVSGNTRVNAEAWENEGEDGGHATANANLLAADDMDNTFVYDDITVTAKADHSEVNVGDLKTIGNGAEITLAAWNAYGSGDGNNGKVNAGDLKTTGWYADITVDAGYGGIHTGNLSTGGYGEGVAHPGDILLTTTNGGDIQTSNISIIA
ncbi:MAG: filamentous hemagglutinin N-terminal domain-containing protein [Pseudomonadota bacterium]